MLDRLINSLFLGSSAFKMFLEVIKAVPNIVKHQFTVTVHNDTGNTVTVFLMLKKIVFCSVHNLGINDIPCADMSVHLNVIAVLGNLPFIKVVGLLWHRD